VVSKRGGNPIDVLDQQARWLREKDVRGIPVNAADPLPPEPAPPPEPEQDDPIAAALIEGQRSLGSALASLAAREQPQPQLTVHMPGPGKPTMKVGRRLADGSVEIREVEIDEEGSDAA